VQFTCWGAEGANEGGNGIDRGLLNVSQVLNAHAFAEVLRLVPRIGVCHVVQPTSQTFRKKSESSSGRKNGGGPEDKAKNQREEAA